MINDVFNYDGIQQQIVYQVDKLAPGNHTITLINRGGSVAIDALIIAGNIK